MSDDLKFIHSQVSIKEYSYYKMGGIAKYMAFPQSIKEIVQAIKFANSQNLPTALLGAGSNSVFADGHIDVLVIALEKLSSWNWETDDILFVESGMTNTQIAEICLNAEHSDAFWLYRMPGQIGASVRMNARCYGGEMQHIVHSILTINPNGQLNQYTSEQIFMGYKNTILMSKPEIVVAVRLYLPNKSSKADILEKMHACENDRHNKKHFLFPSCGSTFKNNHNYGKSSGRIFDELGLKGINRGEAEVSQYHANFIWNKNSARTEDMLTLAAFMRSEAQNKLNVQLDLEVQPVGIFDQKTFNSCGMQNLGFYVQKNIEYYTGFFDVPKNILDESYMKNMQNKFPTKIFSAFFKPYFDSTKLKNPSALNIIAEIWQLCPFSEAKTDPSKPFLRWITICDENYQEIFTKIPISENDCQKLWEFSVSEVFFAHPKKSHYMECEITPYGHHLILRFDDIRKQTREKQEHKIQSFNAPHQSHHTFQFGLEFSLNDLIKYIEDGHIKIQCALSLGDEQYLLAPYWNTKLPDKADFHQPEKFWLLELVK